MIHRKKSLLRVILLDSFSAWGISAWGISAWCISA